MADLPNVSMGHAGGALPDWRKELADEDAPDDDEQLAQTPEDVVSVLGFDPLDEPDDPDDQGDDDATAGPNRTKDGVGARAPGGRRVFVAAG